MKIGVKRKMILELARQNGIITKRQVVEMLGHTYYANASKHLGDILSRMVNAQFLERIQRCKFRYITHTPSQDKIKVNDPNQLTLF